MRTILSRSSFEKRPQVPPSDTSINKHFYQMLLLQKARQCIRQRVSTLMPKQHIPDCQYCSHYNFQLHGLALNSTYLT